MKHFFFCSFMLKQKKGPSSSDCAGVLSFPAVGRELGWCFLKMPLLRPVLFWYLRSGCPLFSSVRLVGYNHTQPPCSLGKSLLVWRTTFTTQQRWKVILAPCSAMLSCQSRFLFGLDQVAERTPQGSTLYLKSGQSFVQKTYLYHTKDLKHVSSVVSLTWPYDWMSWLPVVSIMCHAGNHACPLLLSSTVIALTLQRFTMFNDPGMIDLRKPLLLFSTS